MAKLQSSQCRLKRLVLARLARVVLFSKDTLARSNARGEVTATLSARSFKLGYECLATALWTLELLLLLIGWRMTTEKLECKVLVLLSLLGSHRIKSLQFDKGL